MSAVLGGNIERVLLSMVESVHLWEGKLQAISFLLVPVLRKADKTD
jgi:hypothetical protein